MTSVVNEDQENDDIERWKMKKMVDELKDMKGDGTSLITYIIPKGTQIAQATNMLNMEYGTISNIKSKVNRKSVDDAITSIQQRMKLYNKIPKNGLIIYAGNVIDNNGHDKRLLIDLEPYKAINTSLYRCDNRFHIEAIENLIDSNEKYGFIIVDGSETLYGTLSGNNKEILKKFTISLPGKHNKGGQSSNRFARIREEKRHEYIKRVSEMATDIFINNNKPIINGLVVAGFAHFKTELTQPDFLDQRLYNILLKIVDIQYGGISGFNEAIGLAEDCLSNLKFVKEKKIISSFFSEISLNSSKFIFGIDDTIAALEMGAIEHLIVWENLDIWRHEILSSSDKPDILFLPSKSLPSDDKSHQSHTESISLLDWLTFNYKKLNFHLHFITNKSSEGSQFVSGFGGIGGILRYPIDFSELNISSHTSHNILDDQSYLSDFI